MQGRIIEVLGNKGILRPWMYQDLLNSSVKYAAGNLQ